MDIGMEISLLAPLLTPFGIAGRAGEYGGLGRSSTARVLLLLLRYYGLGLDGSCLLAMRVRGEGSPSPLFFKKDVAIIILILYFLKKYLNRCFDGNEKKDIITVIWFYFLYMFGKGFG
jgi:hypothetical protein